GECELLFVAARADDPACTLLERLLREPGLPARLLISGAVPRHAGEKCLNLIHGVQAAADAEVLAFADADALVRPGWLAALSATLGREGVAAATVPPICLSLAPSLPGFLWTLCTGFFGAFTAEEPAVLGWSWAMRRADFEALEIARAWERSLSDDLAVTRRLREAGRAPAAWALAAVPVCREDMGWRRLFAKAANVFRYVRAYAPGLWLLAGAGFIGKLYLWYWFARKGVWAGLFLFAGLEAAAFAAAYVLLMRRAPQDQPRPPAFWAALLGPPAFLMAGAPYLASLLSRRVSWSGHVYRLRGPEDVEVLS
ncbi:MAG TPA: glycosyltransferase, partial [Elusimicrobiota bacterium]|nr:glycosyltransferase [Elusimicrobiota bacterium]